MCIYGRRSFYYSFFRRRKRQNSLSLAHLLVRLCCTPPPPFGPGPRLYSIQTVPVGWSCAARCGPGIVAGGVSASPCYTHGASCRLSKLFKRRALQRLLSLYTQYTVEYQFLAFHRAPLSFYCYYLFFPFYQRRQRLGEGKKWAKLNFVPLPGRRSSTNVSLTVCRLIRLSSRRIAGTQNKN